MTFEIKKLEEDMATQKLNARLSHQKEVQRLTEKLNSEKQGREEENKNWIDKYDSVAESF